MKEHFEVELEIHETKEFPTEALLSITTGVLLCEKFSMMHEVAEYVVGHSIWTHSFAKEELWNKMKSLVYEQHPDLKDVDVTDVNPSNYKERVAVLLETFGKARVVRKGEGNPDYSPIEDIPEHLKEKTIVLGVV